MHARWYFDFVSPFSYLHWQKIKALPAHIQVDPVPIVFGAVLHALGTRGPAEIQGKRLFTYRIVQWRAQAEGVPLIFPPAHPFNPIAALRLCIAAGTTTKAIDAVFNHLWRDGLAGTTAQELQPVATALGIDDAPAALADPVVKDALRANTDAALAAGVFGVPSLQVGQDLFWGNDAHDLMLAVLADPAMLQRGTMGRLGDLPEGVRRT